MKFIKKSQITIWLFLSCIYFFYFISHFCFSNPSIPCFNVTVEEGHPLCFPLNVTLTIPSLKECNVIDPPSPSTAGLIYSSNRSEISFFDPSYSLSSLFYFFYRFKFSLKLVDIDSVWLIISIEFRKSVIYILNWKTISCILQSQFCNRNKVWTNKNTLNKGSLNNSFNRNFYCWL